MPYSLAQKDPGRARWEEEEGMRIEPMEINLGPSHPAMHGTIRIKAKLSGETIVWADVEIGYLHRAFEKTVEHKTWNQAIPYTDRLNYVSPLINNVGYVLAVEKLLSIQAPERCQYIRVIVSEISRITDHLTCVGATAMELGGFTPFLYFIKAREYWWQLIEEITGARLTISYGRIGGVTRDLPANVRERFEFCAKEQEKAMREVEGMLNGNRIFRDRMEGVGAMDAQRSLAKGFTGPLLRSAGVAYDVRKAFPYLVYDRFQFDIPTGTRGDNYDRYLVRLEEMRQSLGILRQAFEQIPEGPIRVDDLKVSLPEKSGVYSNIEGLMNHFKLIMPGHGIAVPAGEVYQAVEGANGELGFWIIADGSGRPYRVRVRPPCFPLMQGVEEMIVGQQIADEPDHAGTQTALQCHPQPLPKRPSRGHPPAAFIAGSAGPPDGRGSKGGR
jgi:NADH-quinone oxidoreductase subunit D